ncbi:hypothetical protein DXT90_21440 [Agrobacterium tumefaciens]|nr:hypothetical protein [Agrobacterium tumefaciens]
MVEVRDLTAPFQCNGYWLVGEDRLNQIAGVFTYDPREGCRLELHGATWTPEKDDSPTIIIGLSSAGEKITLLNCIPVRSHLRQGAFNLIEFMCEIALVGNYHPPEKLSFKKSSMRFSHLDRWNFAKYVDSRRRRGGSLTVSVKGGPQAKLQCASGGYEVRLEGVYQASVGDLTADIKAFSRLHVFSKTSRPLAWHLSEIESLRDLASFMFASPTPLTNVMLYGTSRRIKGFGQQTEWVSVLFFEENARASSRSAHPLMTLKRLEKVAPDILSAWRDARVRLREVTDLILLILNQHHKTAGAGFLLSMQAFEGFDRIVYPETLVAEEEFKLVSDAMTGAIPQTASPQLREKMKAAIKYANEPSLRNRLKKLHTRLGEKFGVDAFGLKKSSLEPMVKTRNYLTHYPEELKPEILFEDRMVDETDRMCLILVLAILEELGVPSTELLRGIFLHPRFRRFSEAIDQEILKRKYEPRNVTEGAIST